MESVESMESTESMESMECLSLTQERANFRADSSARGRLPDSLTDRRAVLQRGRASLVAAAPVRPLVVLSFAVDPLPLALGLHVREADPYAQETRPGHDSVPEEPGEVNVAAACQSAFAFLYFPPNGKHVTTNGHVFLF